MTSEQKEQIWHDNLDRLRRVYGPCCFDGANDCRLSDAGGLGHRLTPSPLPARGATALDRHL